MEATRGWNDDIMQIDSPPTSPSSEEGVSRKRAREEEDTDEKVSRMRPNGWQPALQTGKRSRQDEEPFRRMTCIKVDHGVIGQKRKREFEVDTVKRQKPFESTHLETDNFAEMTIRRSIDLRLDAMILYLHGCSDAKLAGKLYDQRRQRLEQIAEDAIWLNARQDVNQEKLKKIMRLLAQFN